MHCHSVIISGALAKLISHCHKSGLSLRDGTVLLFNCLSPELRTCRALVSRTIVLVVASAAEPVRAVPDILMVAAGAYSIGHSGRTVTCQYVIHLKS